MFRFLKRTAAMATAIMLVFCCIACKKASSEAKSAETINVYATFYPLYALTEMITDGVDGVNAMCLVQPQDGCLREYQLSDWDLALLLRSADAVIAGGRGLESFESTLFAFGETGPAITAVLYNMDLAHVHAVGIPDDAESHWSDDNPHIYMSVDGAIDISERIASFMQTSDPRFADVYRDNFDVAAEELRKLQDEMHEIADETAGTKAAVLNEACWYLAEEFELDAVLCYHRESGRDIDNRENLIDAVRNSGAELVLIEKQAPYGLVKALEVAGLQVVKLDILSTRSESEGAEGYFEAQLANAEALRAACELNRVISGGEN